MADGDRLRDEHDEPPVNPRALIIKSGADRRAKNGQWSRSNRPPLMRPWASNAAVFKPDAPL